MKLIKLLGGLFAGLSLTVLSGMSVGAQPGTATSGSAGVVRYIEKGQPPVVIHLTVEQARSLREARGNHGNHGKPGGSGGGKSNELIYNGGTSVTGVTTGTIGVETAPRIYLVLWGSQWLHNDPSHEAELLVDFLNAMGGSSWLKTVTQYCQGVSSGTKFCNGQGTPAGYQPVVQVWPDTGSAAPDKPRQSQIAAEAVHAAETLGNTTSGSNVNAQYVIATAHGYNSSGFGKQYCAYHSYTTSSYGDIAYTDLPYITDAGPSCGAGFNGLGKDAGITIVAGHEAAETITDPFPSSGWLDSSGEEIGDKCAWISSGQGAAADVSLGSEGASDTDTDTYAVQSLWSNAYNEPAGGCVLSY